jgi:hypothetical protein
MDKIIDRVMKGRCREFRRRREADIYDNLKITLAYLASINSKLSRSKHHLCLKPILFRVYAVRQKKKKSSASRHRVMSHLILLCETSIWNSLTEVAITPVLN